MTMQIPETLSPKALLREVLEAQPEDASLDEILRELAFEGMVARGLEDARAGRVVGHAEALRSIRSWRN